jgi:alkanesulfonate monooxygenase SsuD/methylene tetrahydromethanopterin reductase-like flavin-dependent oxidoreductase (luciferase family)
MHFGLTIFPTDYSIQPVDLAIEAEARGFESLWFPEHTHIPTSRKSPWPGGAELPKYYYDTYDPFLSLAAAAAATKKIKLATGICLVLSVIRSTPRRKFDPRPALLRPSHLWHWRRPERRGDGQSRHGVCDTLQADARAHHGDEGNLGAAQGQISGEFVNFDEMMQWPQPVQKPHPPIVVGGGFPHAASRAIAYGDGWMPIGGRSDPLDVLPQFRQMAKSAGRDPGSLSFNVFGAPRDLDMLMHY